MGLLDEIKQDTARNYDRSNAVRRVLDSLEKKDRADLEAALQAPVHEVAHSSIARVLQARGFEINENVIGDYRRKRMRR